MKINMICFVKTHEFKKYSIFIDSNEFDSIEVKNSDDVQDKIAELFKRVEQNKNFDVSKIESPKIKEEDDFEFIDWHYVYRNKIIISI